MGHTTLALKRILKSAIVLCAILKPSVVKKGQAALGSEVHRLDFDIQDGGLANAGMIQARLTLVSTTDVENPYWTNQAATRINYIYNPVH